MATSVIELTGYFFNPRKTLTTKSLTVEHYETKLQTNNNNKVAEEMQINVAEVNNNINNNNRNNEKSCSQDIDNKNFSEDDVKNQNNRLSLTDVSKSKTDGKSSSLISNYLFFLPGYYRPSPEEKDQVSTIENKVKSEEKVSEVKTSKISQRDEELIAAANKKRPSFSNCRQQSLPSTVLCSILFSKTPDDNNKQPEQSQSQSKQEQQSVEQHNQDSKDSNILQKCSQDSLAGVTFSVKNAPEKEEMTKGFWKNCKQESASEILSAKNNTAVNLPAAQQKAPIQPKK